jgi:hypothetical protein
MLIRRFAPTCESTRESRVSGLLNGEEKRTTSMSENNAMTEGTASEEATTVKTENCTHCGGTGHIWLPGDQWSYYEPVEDECYKCDWHRTFC